ncbi:hypothetical protein HN662_00865, partial [Candidatus Woesearchaeota archaeon]|nr:hypothetical protein [Candidatus Woesearchaeota archaeon]
YKMLEDEGFVAGWHKAFGSGELSAHPTSSLAVPELKFSLLTHFIGFSRKAHFGKWEALYSLVTGEKMKWAIQHGLPFDICTLSEAEKERSLDTQLGLQSTLSKYVLEKGAEITEDYDRMKAELKEVTRQSREQGKQIESLSGRTAYLKSEVRSHKESEAALREELADVHASREKTVAAAVEKHKTSRAQEFADVQRDLGRLTYVEEQARKAELECAEVTTAYEASQKRVDDLEDQVSDLEQQVALLSEDEVEPVEVAFSVKNAPEDVLSRAERLLRLKNPPGTKPIKKVKEGPQDNLSRIFSYLGERTYFKIKLPHHWRGIYVIERDKTILLMVLPHDEYDYLGHKVNYTPTKYVNGARGNA